MELVWIIIGIIDLLILAGALRLYILAYKEYKEIHESHINIDRWFLDEFDVIATAINAGKYEDAITIIDFLTDKVDKLSEDITTHKERIVMLKLVKKQVLQLKTQYDNVPPPGYVKFVFNPEDEDISI